MKETEGSARRYRERRARISVTYQQFSQHIRYMCKTFMVSIKHVVICIAKSKIVCQRRLLVPMSILGLLHQVVRGESFEKLFLGIG